MTKHKKKPQKTVKKFNIKEYAPIIAIIVAVALFVGAFVVMDMTKPVYTDATVYFMDANKQYVPQSVQVDETKMEKGVIEALMNGPVNSSYIKAVEGDFRVLSVKTEDGLCTIDLSEEFIAANTGNDKEAYAVFAIVNTLCMLPDVEKVKLNIDGDEEHFLGGRVNLSLPFEPDWNMVVYEARPQS